MPISRHKITQELRPLPFSAQDSAYIIRTGSLEFKRAYIKPPNTSGFYLDDLPGNAILSWPPELPRYDPRCHPSSPAYLHWKKAHESKIGIAGNYFMFKAGGLVPCHSALERMVLSCLEMNPFVVEIRAQYPEWDRELYRERARLGMKMLKNSVMTIDFIVTLKIPGESNFRYHAISCKPYALLNEIPVIKRHSREEAFVGMWGCTHEIMTEHTYSRIQSENCRRLKEYMRYVDDIAEFQAVAKTMAVSLTNQKNQMNCDRRISIAAKENGFSLNEGYRYFAIATFLGYVKIDHRYAVLPDSPLYFRNFS